MNPSAWGDASPVEPCSHAECEEREQRYIAQAAAMGREIERLREWKDSLKFCPQCIGMVEPQDALQHVGRCGLLADENERLRKRLAFHEVAAAGRLERITNPYRCDL